MREVIDARATPRRSSPTPAARRRARRRGDARPAAARCASLFESHPGDCAVSLHVRDPGRERDGARAARACAACARATRCSREVNALFGRRVAEWRALRRARGRGRGSPLRWLRARRRRASRAPSCVRVERSGSVPLAAGARPAVRPPRQAALEARRSARPCERVGARARSSTRTAARAPRSRRLDAALGDGSARSTSSRFRILEDRGERAPLLERRARRPSAEYVVVVEAQVDADRGCAQRLAQAGLLGAPAAAAARAARVADRVRWTSTRYPALRGVIERRSAARGGAVAAARVRRGRVVARASRRRAEPASALVGRLGRGARRRPRRSRSLGDGRRARCCAASRRASQPDAGDVPAAAAVEAAPAPPTD